MLLSFPPFPVRHPAPITVGNLKPKLNWFFKPKFKLKFFLLNRPSERHDGRDRRARGEKDHADLGRRHVVAGVKEGLVLVGLRASRRPNTRCGRGKVDWNLARL